MSSCANEHPVYRIRLEMVLRKIPEALRSQVAASGQLA